MIVFYKNYSQKKHQRVITHLYDSCPFPKQIFYTNQFSANARINQKADAIVFAGMIRGEGLIYKWCQANRKRFFYLDHAYLNRGYNESDPDNEWFRITDSDFLWNKMEYRSLDRWEKYFSSKHKIQPWRLNKGKNILLLPPSQATQYIFPRSRLWTDHTIRKIKKVTDKDIIIREKPTQQIIDSNNQIIKPLTFKHDKTIEQELDDAFLVVSYSSGVTVDALLRGIPVICDQNNVAAPMSMKIEEIGSYALKDRMPWFHQLVHHQFLTKEMITGEVWNYLVPTGKLT